jgi:hypothetical protein
MAPRLLALFVLPALLLPAKSKKDVASATAENDDLTLKVTMYIDPEAVKEIIGNDLQGHYIVADVTVEPKYGKTVAIDRDDFTLRTDKDGSKSTPWVASQVAGRGALIIKETGPTDAAGGGGGVMLGDPMGYPGGYPGGYPPYGYPDPASTGTDIGRATGPGGGDTGAHATVRSSARDKVNPLEKTLDDHILRNGKTEKPVHGLLYFPMEKQKMKDLELYYGGKENRITMRFKP